MQNKADIEILSRGDISIKPSLKEQKPLSSYVNLNKIDKNHIQLNINELNQILDLNGFNEEHQITFINNNNSQAEIRQEGNSIIINNEKVVRLWGEIDSLPDASISSDTEKQCAEKGAPLLYVPRTSIQTLNTELQHETKSFKHIESGTIHYASRPNKVIKLHQNNQEYDYQGILFSNKSSNDTKDIYRFTNTETGEIIYSHEYPQQTEGIVRSKKPVFEAAITKEKDHEAYYQLRDAFNGRTSLVNENDPILYESKANANIVNDGVIFFAKPEFEFINLQELPKSNSLDQKLDKKSEAIREAGDEQNHQIVDTTIKNRIESNEELERFSIQDGVSDQEVDQLINALMIMHEQNELS